MQRAEIGKRGDPYPPAHMRVTVDEIFSVKVAAAAATGTIASAPVEGEQIWNRTRRPVSTASPTENTRRPIPTLTSSVMTSASVIKNIAE